MSGTKQKNGGTWTAVISIIAVALAAILAVGLIVFLWNDTAPDKPTSPTAETVSLNDTITATGWGEAVTLSAREDSPAQSVHSGVTYGTVFKGGAMRFSGKIADDGNVTEVWFAPLVGIYSEATGFIVRSDSWVLGGAPDDGFTNAFSGTPNSGEADGESELWTVYLSGDSWGAEEAKSSVAYSVEFAYGADGIFSITQSIETADGEKLTSVYSVRVPDGEYNTYFYGENCSYTFTSMTISEE